MTWGWTVIENKFPVIMAGLDLKVEAIVAKAALDIQGNAQTRAPVDTGMLRNSVQAMRVGKHHWQVVVGADYGVYVEYGTSKMAAQPYFAPAIERVRPQFVAAMKGAL